jgi:hypothetical protein
MMSKPKIHISQSLIKAFTDDACPAYINAVYIEKTAKTIPGLSMVMGSYFEHLALGAGHAHDETPVTDLPRLKSGEKSVAQQRIEAQAEKFKEICKERPIVIDEKQLEIVLPYNDDFELAGTLDFVGKIDNIEQVALFDLKLTSSIYREHIQGGYGQWSWAFPFNMDFTQAYMYHYLFTQFYSYSADEVAFYYFVMDYKLESEYIIIKKKVERMHIMELMESIRKTIEKIEFHKSSKWEYNPLYKNCVNCALKHSCPVKNLQKPIQTV